MGRRNTIYIYIMFFYLMCDSWLIEIIIFIVSLKDYFFSFLYWQIIQFTFYDSLKLTEITKIPYIVKGAEARERRASYFNDTAPNTMTNF